MTVSSQELRPVIRAEDIRVVLGGTRVLDGIDVAVYPGEFVSLIGSNGAGKTTLLRTLLGTVKPVRGKVTRPGRGRIGYLPQSVAIDPDTPLRARDVVALGRDGGRLGVPLRRRAFWERIDGVLDAVEATEFADQRIGELSGGQQQRVLLAHALVSEPDVLLLDEPLASLDPASAGEIVVLLDRVRNERNIAVVLTAHDLNLLLPVTNRIVYVANGHAVSGSPEQVVRSDVLSTLYGHPIRVLNVDGRVIVIADDDPVHTEKTPTT